MTRHMDDQQEARAGAVETPMPAVAEGAAAAAGADASPVASAIPVMSTATPAEAASHSLDAPSAALPRRPRARRTLMRFLLAFTFGLLAVLAISAGVLAAYESSNAGRILAGVHVGSVDLSGLAPSEAAVRLRAAYGAFGEGQLVLGADGKERTVTYADLGRRIDVDAIVAEAMTVGRAGPAIERLASNVRILVRGVEIAPQATLERAALRYEISALAATVDAPPVDASVAAGKSGFDLTPAANGRSTDVDAALRAGETLLGDPNAPSTVRVDLPVAVVEPAVTTDEAKAAHDAAERIATDITLVNGSESWTLEGSAIRGWISFAETADGGYRPVVAQDGLEAGLAAIAEKVAIAPVDATFLMSSSSKVVGVTGAKDGRALDIPNTVATLVKMVDQRAAGLNVSLAPISLTVVKPTLTTAEATKTAPLMQPISEWTTYFPIYVNNGFGANIWIPARDINGQVVLPGQWFDFWKAIGPVTRAHGYKDGGAIIDGHTEPQGALAGGICSCSTTLFNAAVRAGLEMGARRNHYYYIDRYPLGLDATVFQSSSGSVQTMSFRNDTSSPILIVGTGWSVGSKGYVKFVLWSVPTGRTTTFSTPIVKNITKAADTIAYTTALAPGVKKRIEFPVDGKDVWVTRTVKDASGAIVHQETYFSHYSRVTGVTQVGVAPAPAPEPTPTP